MRPKHCSAQLKLYLLRVLRKSNIKQTLLVSFYCPTEDSILPYSSVWCSSAAGADKKVLQRVTETAVKITGWPPPSLEELHSSCCLRPAHNIFKDTPHPGGSLFELLLSSRWHRAINTRINRLMNSFYTAAIPCVNTHTCVNNLR